MKCTFRHTSHIMPMWISIGGDYGTLNPKRMLGSDLSNLPFGGMATEDESSGWKIKKGCGIGCVLAANSCEGVSSVDARTVAAPDAITAFALPNPDCSSQGSRFFRVWWLDELPRRVDHPAYFGLATSY
jgi:hypothetical protein